MATYQISINERMSLGKSIIALLQSAKEAVTFVPVREKTMEKTETHSPLYYKLGSAFKDVKLIMDGKQKRQTLDEFLDELRNSND